MRLPSLPSDKAAITNSLLVYKCTATLFRFDANVLVAGNAFTFREARGGEYLDAMADGKDPFLLRVELADNIEQPPIVAEVLRSTTSKNENGIVVIHIYLVERDVGLQAVAGALDVGIPPWLEVVHYEMEATNRRSGNGGAPLFLPKPMDRIKRFIRFTGISGNN